MAFQNFFDGTYGDEFFTKDELINRIKYILEAIIDPYVQHGFSGSTQAQVALQKEQLIDSLSKLRAFEAAYCKLTKRDLPEDLRLAVIEVRDMPI